MIIPIFYCGMVMIVKQVLKIVSSHVLLNLHGHWNVNANNYNYEAMNGTWKTALINQILCIHSEKCSFNCFSLWRAAADFMCQNECKFIIAIVLRTNNASNWKSEGEPAKICMIKKIHFEGDEDDAPICVQHFTAWLIEWRELNHSKQLSGFRFEYTHATLKNSNNRQSQTQKNRSIQCFRLSPVGD